MRGLCRAVMACFMIVALAGCAAVPTTALEPQSRQRDSRLARLYFVWADPYMFKTGTLDIKVDGQVVGKIAPDSYLFVDRRPGTYTLKVEPPFDFAYFEADMQVAAGATYYFAVAQKSAYAPLSGGAVVAIHHPSRGGPMQPK